MRGLSVVVAVARGASGGVVVAAGRLERPARGIFSRKPALRGAGPAAAVPAIPVLGRGAPDSVHRQSANLPVVQQGRVPTMQTVQKTAEIPQVLFLVHVAVNMQRQVPPVLSDSWRCLKSVHRQSLWRLGDGCDAFRGLFRTPSIRTSSPGFQRTFLSPRWLLVVEGSGVPESLGVLLQGV